MDKASNYKQAHQLAPGDLIALHYSTPAARVILKVAGDDGSTTLILSVPSDEPVRYLNSGDSGQSV